MVENNTPNTEIEFSRLLTQITSEPSAPQENFLKQEDIEDRKQDRKLRKSYANKWFWAIAGQLLVVNLVFIYLVVTGQADNWTFRAYLSATILETFGIVYIITGSLFPRNQVKSKTSQR